MIMATAAYKRWMVFAQLLKALAMKKTADLIARRKVQIPFERKREKEKKKKKKSLGPNIKKEKKKK